MKGAGCHDHRNHAAARWRRSTPRRQLGVQQDDALRVCASRHPRDSGAAFFPTQPHLHAHTTAHFGFFGFFSNLRDDTVPRVIRSITLIDNVFVRLVNLFRNSLLRNCRNSEGGVLVGGGDPPAREKQNETGCAGWWQAARCAHGRLYGIASPAAGSRDQRRALRFKPKRNTSVGSRRQPHGAQACSQLWRR